MPYDVASRAAFLDETHPITGTIGYIALIDNLTASLTVASINTTTNVITLTADHGLVTGTRVRGTSTGALPGAIASATDYYVRVVDADELTLHPTLGDAQGDTNELDFTDTGSGTITLLEQALKGGLDADTIFDPLTVWINHEINHTDYARIEVVGLGAANTATAAKPLYLHAITANAPNGTLTFKHAVMLHDGTSTIGDTAYSKFAARSLAAQVSITEGATKTLNFSFFMDNATT